MEQLQLKAYAIFVDEIQKHLVLAKDALRVELNLEQAIKERLGAAFHNIKGGAGFFQLQELAECARKLERLVRDSSSQQLISQVTTYSDYLAELEVLMSQMPAPKRD